MDNQLDILLRFVLDQAAQGNTVKGIEAIERSLKSFQDEMEEAKKDAKELKQISSELGQVARNTFLLGTAITGGIFAGAAAYVKNAKEATLVTLQWKTAQDTLNRSSARFGAVFAQEALPLLQKAAALADTAAGFVERNPEIVRAALNTGLVLAGLGAVGIAVSKGIRLVADVAYITAVAQEQIGIAAFARAVDKFLIGTGQFAGAQAGGTVRGIGSTLQGAITSPLGSVGLIVATAAASFKAADSLKQLEERLVQIGGPAAAPFIGFLDVVTRTVNPLIPAIKDLRSSLERDMPAILKLLGLGGTAAASGPGSVGGRTAATSALRSSGISPEALKAYEQYRREDIALVQQHYAERNKIIDNALAASQKANADYAASVARVQSQTTGALTSAARDFAEASRQAEIQNAQERARIVRDGGQEIQQIEQDLQETLRKNRIEFEQRAADLTASRDALGLAKETRRFNQEQDEARREANLEIRRRRADIAQRLADLQQSFEQERAQRFADYQARVAEIHSNAAQQLGELRTQHAAELREIQLQKIARIRELDAQFVEERNRKNQQLIQTLRDIDAGLLGEKHLREQYQASMLQDLEAFLAAYKSRLGSLGDIPARAAGGYASGIVRTGEAGYEYVLSHTTTKAAEAVIGGRLTQESLMSALMGSARGGASVVWNDQRRFDGSYTNEIRRANREDTLRLLDGIFA